MNKKFDVGKGFNHYIYSLNDHVNAHIDKGISECVDEVIFVADIMNSLLMKAVMILSSGSEGMTLDDKKKYINSVIEVLHTSS